MLVTELLFVLVIFSIFGFIYYLVTMRDNGESIFLQNINSLIKNGDTKTTFIFDNTKYGGPLNSNGWPEIYVIKFIKSNSLKIENINNADTKYHHDFLSDIVRLEEIIRPTPNEDKEQESSLVEELSEISNESIKTKNAEIRSKIKNLKRDERKVIRSAVNFINENINLFDYYENWLFENLSDELKKKAQKEEFFPFKIYFKDHIELQKIEKNFINLKSSFYRLSLISFYPIRYTGFKDRDLISSIYEKSDRIRSFEEKNKIHITIENEDDLSFFPSIKITKNV